MSLELVISIGAGVIAAAIAVIGYLVVRAVNSVDQAVAELRAEVRALMAKDTQVEVRIAELHVRVTRLELDVAQYIATQERTGT